MKSYLIIFSFFIITQTVFAQQQKYVEKTIKSAAGTYQTVEGDPLKTRIYTLKNGLTVYLSVYKNAPRIQTFIAVRAGSKNDPSNATGLAHYLEHILFKGTPSIGSNNWAKEKVELAKIENLYEVYRNTKDVAKRKTLYHQIDSISLVASDYAIPNEYDKMLSAIGASGTNAYTFLEQTVYVNDIPSNQIDKWSQIEAERFSAVVPRLFHTELEAVYEEKNRGLDNDGRKVYEVLMETLFPKHTYGTQTTIGTIEHLQNPSITAIKKYFDTYYVPNNIAICLSGDLDPDQTIASIEKYFGAWKPKPLPKYTPPIEAAIKQPIEKVIKGPDAENLTIAYRLPGNSTKASLTAEMMGMVLSNGKAGVMDLNLNQQQKVLTASAYAMRFNDYSIFALSGKPKEGQSLESLKALLLAQVEAVKQGKFEDWLLTAIINDYKIYKMRELESNKARADLMVDAFISGRKWVDIISEVDKLSQLTKADIVAFANQYFNQNYVEIKKITGADTTIQKVLKPAITPVKINREQQSTFYTKVFSKQSPDIKPVFLDYTKDLTLAKMKSGVQVIYKQNVENGIFSMTIVVDIGKDINPAYAIAVDYIDYLGTKQYDAEALKKEFYKLGCNYSISISADAISLSLTGLEDNFVPALDLFQNLISQPVDDENALAELKARIIKSRGDAKLSKGILLNGAMLNFAKYGAVSPFTNVLSNKQVNELKSTDLTSLIKNILTYQHRILYYGPKTTDDFIKVMNEHHQIVLDLKATPVEKKFDYKKIDKNIVYWLDYNMVQAEIVLLSKSIDFDKNIIPQMNLYNEYFGGGMGSLVFQEMRESKALAYSVKSTYQSANKLKDPNWVYSYIGTQADKIMEATDGMLMLIDSMPKSESLFVNAKDNLIETINTQRITKASILSSYEAAKKLGLTTDIRKEIYDWAKQAKYIDIKDFQEQYVKGQKRTMLVLGSKDKIDFEKLKQYGEVKQLTKEELFGY